MIALIRADGCLGKRAVWFVSEGWFRVNLGEGESRRYRARGGVSVPILVTGMARLPANQLPQDEHPVKRNPRENSRGHTHVPTRGTSGY